MPERGSVPTSFLGTGWSFPPEFAAGGAEVAMVSEVEDVHQSLAILFATRPGERPMQESFGCVLEAFSFEELETWQARLSGRYAFPHAIGVGANVQVQSGWPWARLVSVVLPTAGTQTFYQEDIGNNRSDTVPLVGLRAD